MDRLKFGLSALCGFAIGQALTAPLALAAVSPSDFFCRKIPVQPPSYFKSQVQTCSDGKVAPAQGVICMENAYCTYVGEDLKATEVASEDGSKKTFKDLSQAQKAKYLVDNVEPADWFPSTLTCAKKSPVTSSECPPIDQCKGDINYRWHQGTYGADVTAAYGSVPPQDSGAFQNVEDSDASKAEPAK